MSLLYIWKSREKCIQISTNMPIREIYALKFMNFEQFTDDDLMLRVKNALGLCCDKRPYTLSVIHLQCPSTSHLSHFFLGFS